MRLQHRAPGPSRSGDARSYLSVLVNVEILESDLALSSGFVTSLGLLFSPLPFLLHDGWDIMLPALERWREGHAREFA